MKCRNSTFNAQDSRVIIVVAQVGAVKALREKERQDETQFTTKIDGKN
jgi:intracellular sulfur oxidation DsrE/DsrF family protein